MALEAIDVVRNLTVIEGGRKRGRPSKEDEARLDLLAHRAEESEQAEAVQPYLRRLELYLHDAGPAAWQTLAVVARWHERHGRRWSGDDAQGAA
jgi:hypothetical protein